jgi:chromosome segregation ATPase
MAQETLQQLKTELETLRRENQLLRESVGRRKNGHQQELPETVRPTNLLPAFQQQLQHLKQANIQLAAASTLFTDLHRSLEALIPALEVQITGWTNEIYQLQQAQQDLEQAYATVVSRLEGRIKALKTQVAEASPEGLQQQFSSLQKERERMRRRIAELEATCQTYEAQIERQVNGRTSTTDDQDNPFTDLNIFGA